ncbi:MAG: EthD domain-containing protein [Deltaproteobacteria bacterium]|nr:MAG: EthD domain-containing protein [Deltaproteobacteria bacterium]
MHKFAYVVWLDRVADRDALEGHLLERAAPRLRAGGGRERVVNVVDVEASLRASMPLVREAGSLAGLVTLRAEAPGGPEGIEEIARAVPGRIAGYRVAESIPLDWERPTAPAGRPTPGVKLVTLFDKPKDLSEADFHREWHEVHTPLSLEIHPLWRYVRNAVERRVAPAGPAFRGIVEETFRTLEDVVDPERFYGSRANMKRVAEHVTTFIDLERIETGLMREYRLDA